jgi:hypothetical protein
MRDGGGPNVDAINKARHVVGLARGILVASEHVAGAAESIESAKIPDITALRRALDELATAWRSLDAGVNDVVEATDRVLDSFDASTRHILK